MVMVIVLNSNLFLLVFCVSMLDASQQFLLDLAGELEAERVLVAELLAYVTRIGPGRLGAGPGATASMMGPRGRAVIVVVVIVVAVILVVVVAGREQ